MELQQVDGVTEIHFESIEELALHIARLTAMLDAQLSLGKGYVSDRIPMVVDGRGRPWTLRHLIVPQDLESARVQNDVALEPSA
jgi:hypothetical protein